MQSSNSGETTLILVLVVLAAVLVRKGRNDPASKDLEKRQRIRPLLLEWLDPFIAGAFVGTLLWHDLSKGATHIVAGVLGGAIGVGIGLLRARVMFVHALPSSKSVVLTRSTAEYLLLALLLVVRSFEGALDRVHSGPLTLVLAALLALAILESVTRSVAITVKYRWDAASASHPDGSKLEIPTPGGAGPFGGK